jgi:tryptophanyl-tRNA synthetase
MGLLPGTDGREKMGKSLNNAINLSDDPKTIERKVMRMYTDPNRVSPTAPGTVEGNPVFVYLDTFDPDAAEVAELKARYAAGSVGDVEVKRRLVEAIERFVAPIRERREELAAKPGLVDEILAAGAERVRREAQATLHEVREAMHLDYFGL